jgi:PPK2 family polyphosphate:nucleotide phosphotransferase
MDEPSVRALLRVGAGPVDLGAIDPRGTPGVPPDLKPAKAKAWSQAQVDKIGAELARQQEMLYATAKTAPDSRPRLLIVLQAMDCGGKDGTVKHVAGTMNPQGLHIVGFGPPTPEERRHHFLWRVRRALPPAGYVGIFNRSHYEDVLIVRVESLVRPEVWGERYDEINSFEVELTDSGFTLVKIFLHISYEEQGKRLLARLDDPEKRWKYNPDDLEARGRWDDYRAAYVDALSRCATTPWYVVPADRKWYRNWAVASLLRETFADLRLAYPQPDFDVEAERRRLLATAERATRRASV